jgi:hypothetical protein
MQDLLRLLNCKNTIAPVSNTGSAVTGSGVDLAGYEGAIAVIDGGNWTAGMGSYAMAMKESSDNVTYTAVAAADILGTQPTLSGQVYRGDVAWGYRGSKRYLRVDATHTGYTTACYFGVLIVRGMKRHQPSTQGS